MKTYNKLKEDGKQFEVVFVSSDRDEESWEEYLSSMPWYSLPFSDNNRKKALSRKFDVSGKKLALKEAKRGREEGERGRERGGRKERVRKRGRGERKIDGKE